MSFPLYHALSFVFICNRVEEIRFGYEKTFYTYLKCNFVAIIKMNKSRVKIETILLKAGNFVSPNKMSPKLIENGIGATQWSMSLQAASRVTRDYSNR